jgi:hypothetical protein
LGLVNGFGVGFDEADQSLEGLLNRDMVLPVHWGLGGDEVNKPEVVEEGGFVRGSH